VTYTKNLRTLEKEIGRLRQALSATEDELLELRDREKRLAALDDEGTAEVAAHYGMEN
jgi:predicted  nucleic acid-binding Zn-ribbon protein